MEIKIPREIWPEFENAVRMQIEHLLTVKTDEWAEVGRHQEIVLNGIHFKPDTPEN